MNKGLSIDRDIALQEYFTIALIRLLDPIIIALFIIAYPFFIFGKIFIRAELIKWC